MIKKDVLKFEKFTKYFWIISYESANLKGVQSNDSKLSDAFYCGQFCRKWSIKWSETTI